MAAASSPPNTPDENQQRFEEELEFVQALANPEYLHYLAQNRLLDDPAFVEYLDYLQYWHERPYRLYIAFPHCLRMLELLQGEPFRSRMKFAEFKDHIFQQQHWHWRYRVDAPAAAAAAAEPSG